MWNIIQGIFFVIIGLYFIEKDTFYYSVVFVGAGTVLLIWGIVNEVRNNDTKSSQCPKCGRKFSRKEHQAFQGFSSRKASPCPGCQTVLIISKWPFRMINVAPYMFDVAACLASFLHETLLVVHLSITILLVGVLLFDIGSATSRFEIVDEPKMVAEGDLGRQEVEEDTDGFGEGKG